MDEDDVTEKRKRREKYRNKREEKKWESIKEKRFINGK